MQFGWPELVRRPRCYSAPGVSPCSMEATGRRDQTSCRLLAPCREDASNWMVSRPDGRLTIQAIAQGCGVIRLGENPVRAPPFLLGGAVARAESARIRSSAPSGGPACAARISSIVCMRSPPQQVRLANAARRKDRL